MRWLLLFVGVLLIVSMPIVFAEVAEISLDSTSEYTESEKYQNVTLHAVFTDSNKELKVPGFYAGDNVWKIRFSGHGSYDYITYSNDPNLDGVTGTITIQEPQNFIVADGRYLKYQNQTPFLWVAGTLWRANSYVMSMQDLDNYLDDRKQKDFTAIQFKIASPQYSQDFPGDYEKAQAHNSNGAIFSKEFDEINTAHFNELDLRIQKVLDRDMVPVLFFNWGNTYLEMNDQEIQQYVRYLVSRYHAYNVIWSVSGEYMMQSDPNRIDRLNQIITLIKDTDPNNHLIMIHPGPGDQSVTSAQHFPQLDIIAHHTWQANERELIKQDYTHNRPIINAEAGYEGMWEHDTNRVRREAWTVMLSGAAGYTYGAREVWSWGEWQGGDPNQGIQRPGSTQMKHLTNFLQQTDWQQMQPSNQRIMLYNNTTGEKIIYTTSNEDIRGFGRWYNPQTGEFSNSQFGPFIKPTDSTDYILHIFSEDIFDINDDGKCNILDLVLIRMGFISQSKETDLNRDGKTDLKDLIILRRHFD